MYDGNQNEFSIITDFVAEISTHILEFVVNLKQTTEPAGVSAWVAQTSQPALRRYTVVYVVMLAPTA